MLFYESLGIKSHLVPWGYQLVIMTIFHSLKHKERRGISGGPTRYQRLHLERLRR
jgi:hypothetical protein